MAITTRETTATGVTNKNAPLTNAELDQNFVDLISNPVRYKIKATANLSKGAVVRITGYNSGENAYEVATVSAAAHVAVGLVETALSTGDFGLITNTGLFEGLNTDAFDIGDILYPNTSGGLTDSRPTSGHYQAAAYVLRAHSNNGAVMVEFSEPRDANLAAFKDEFTLPTADGTAGQVLKTDGAGNIGFSDAADLTAETRHSIRPSLLLDFANSKTLDPRIDFTRSSTATYYDGKTHAKAEENLIPYSDFSSGWSDESKTTINLNNATAPDGTTTAAKLNGTSNGGYYYYYDQVTIDAEGKLTGSMYLKEGTLRYAYLQLILGSSNTRQSILWDLNTGTQVDSDTTGTPTGVSHSITSVGNGWYRCTVTADKVSGGDGFLLVGMAQSASPTWNDLSIAQVTSSTSDNIYIWGAQLESRDSVTAYTPTTSQPITNYIPVLQTAASGTARFDHDPVTGESKGLLIEEQRTNYTDSSVVNTGYWNLTKVSLISNTIIAPDGTLTGAFVKDDTQTGEHAIIDHTPISAGTWTVSAYLKAANITEVALQLYSASGTNGNHITRVDLTDGTIVYDGSGLATSVHVGNGWYRVSVTIEATASITISNWIYSVINGSINHTGDGSSGFYIWGVQLEAGSFPTSYIPTSGSQVTRSADIPYIAFQDFGYSKKSGTALLNGQNNSDISAYQSYYIGTNNNGYARWSYSNSGQTALSVYASGDTGLSASVGSLTDNGKFKIGVAVDEAGVTNTLNGTYNTSTGTTHNFRSLASHFYIGTNASGQSINGWVSKFAYYPTRLTNAELQALTED